MASSDVQPNSGSAKSGALHNSSAVFVAVLLCAVVLAVASLFIGQGTASGAGEADATTLGLGMERITADKSRGSFDAAARLGVAEAESADLLVAPQRSVALNDIVGPVVALAAVDAADEHTVAAAAKIGVVNPPESIARVAEDTSGSEWLVGMASGYDVDSSSTLTYSGRSFDDECVTVAVPQGMEELVGRPIEIVYKDKVVVATVTDTGGFAKYGRALDLGGGVFKAFGFEDIWDWGVREVHYRYL